MRRVVSVYYVNNYKEYITVGIDAGQFTDPEKGECLRIVYIHKVNRPGRDRFLVIPVKNILSQSFFGNLSYHEKHY